MAARAEWFVHLSGVEEGPLTSQTLLILVKTGKIFPDTQIRKEGMTKTVPASKVKGLLGDPAKSNNMAESPAIPDSRPGTTQIPKRDAKISGHKELPTSWLSFYAYAYLPFNIIASIALTSDQHFGQRGTTDTAGFILYFVFIIAIAVFKGFIVYGLHKRRLWAWTLNWVVLCSIVLLGPIGRGANYFVVFLSLGLVFFLPNFIYFKKRRSLFS